jgi:TRAP-type C4-dicarboxylate transport system permease small subunit
MVWKYIKGALYNFEKIVSCSLLVVVLLTLTYQVLTRYAFANPSTWSEEISRYLFVWVIFLSGSYAVQQNAHIRIDSAPKLWPVKARKWVLLLGDLLWLAASIAILVISYRWVKMQAGSGALSIVLGKPMWYFYAAVPVGYAFLIIRLSINIAKKLKAFSKGLDG